MYFVYALFYKSGNRIYVGMTKNVKKRIQYHKRGKTRSTKNRSEFFIRIIEKCADRIAAREKEKYWKSGCGKERLKKYYSGVEQSGSSGGS